MFTFLLLLFVYKIAVYQNTTWLQWRYCRGGGSIDLSVRFLQPSFWLLCRSYNHNIEEPRKKPQKKFENVNSYVNSFKMVGSRYLSLPIKALITCYILKCAYSNKVTIYFYHSIDSIPLCLRHSLYKTI